MKTCKSMGLFSITPINLFTSKTELLHGNSMSFDNIFCFWMSFDYMILFLD